jgi:hypothetical protein
MNYILKSKDPLNEWNVILIYYFMDFLNPKNFTYLKSSCKHFKIIILRFFFICLIAS